MAPRSKWLNVAGAALLAALLASSCTVPVTQPGREPTDRKLVTQAEKLSREIVAFTQALRGQDLFKPPGIAETLDWATALRELDAKRLTPEIAADTLGALLKYQDDIARLQGERLKTLVDAAAKG